MCENKDEIINFVNKSTPIVITYNGQRQVLVPKSELNLKGRDFVKERLIIQIIGDTLSPEGQRIFSSTRDRARKNTIYSELISRLKKALADDEELKVIDQKIKEKVLSSQTSQQEKKAMELLEKLLGMQEKVSEKSKIIFNDDVSLPVTRTPRKIIDDDLDTEEEIITPVIAKPIPQLKLNYIPTKLELLNCMLSSKLKNSGIEIISLAVKEIPFFHDQCGVLEIHEPSFCLGVFLL